MNRKNYATIMRIQYLTLIFGYEFYLNRRMLFLQRFQSLNQIYQRIFIVLNNDVGFNLLSGFFLNCPVSS